MRGRVLLYSDHRLAGDLGDALEEVLAVLGRVDAVNEHRVGDARSPRSFSLGVHHAVRGRREAFKALEDANHLPRVRDQAVPGRDRLHPLATELEVQARSVRGRHDRDEVDVLVRGRAPALFPHPDEVIERRVVDGALHGFCAFGLTHERSLWNIVPDLEGREQDAPHPQALREQEEGDPLELRHLLGPDVASEGVVRRVIRLFRVARHPEVLEVSRRVVLGVFGPEGGVPALEADLRVRVARELILREREEALHDAVGAAHVLFGDPVASDGQESRGREGFVDLMDDLWPVFDHVLLRDVDLGEIDLGNVRHDCLLGDGEDGSMGRLKRKDKSVKDEEIKIRRLLVGFLLTGDFCNFENRERLAVTNVTAVTNLWLELDNGDLVAATVLEHLS